MTITSTFGQGLAGRLAGDAARYRLAAEEPDCLWEARAAERWIGAYDSLDEEDGELDSVLVIGQIERRWYTAVCLVDGEGRPQGLLETHWHGRADRARKAYRALH